MHRHIDVKDAKDAACFYTSTTFASFNTAWFGGNPPAGFMLGSYTGSGVGLSSGGDAVNIFDAAGTSITGVTFGASTQGVTFDNAAGTEGAIATLSVGGVNGAFTSADGREVGSPGVAPVPEPAGLLGVGALLAGVGGLLRRRLFGA